MNYVISGNIRLVRDSDKKNRTCSVVIEAKLTSLEIDISGKNVIENNILDEVISVIFLIKILLEVAQSNCTDIGILLGKLVITVNKNRILGMNLITEGLIGAAVNNTGLRIHESTCCRRGYYLAYSSKLTARNNRTGFIDDSDRSVDCTPHLMNNSLKKSV